MTCSNTFIFFFLFEVWDNIISESLVMDPVHLQTLSNFLQML